VKKATVLSVCECQARLGAELDESRYVIRGWARDPRRRQERPAPAHAIDSSKPQFEIAWFCPFCVRNTTRVFDADGLGWREAPEEPGKGTAQAS
jgi:hypothetical protein